MSKRTELQLRIPSFSLLLLGVLLLQPSFLACNNVLGILWTAVPPSTNPRSKVNQEFLADLSSATTNVREVQDGRIWFETNHEEEVCSSLRHLQARSVRLVALESHNVDLDDKDGDNGDILDERSIILSLLTQERNDNDNSWKNQLSSALNVWNMSGNRKAKLEEDVTFTISCQKWSTFLFPQVSSTQMCHEMSNVFREEYGWNRIMKKKTASTITYQFHLLLFGSSAILELVTFVAPPKTFLNLPNPGFRRLESFVVVKAANILPGDTVLDPMCGKATFLIEAWTHHPTSTFYGIDLSHEQLQDAIENCQAAAASDAIHLTLGDACDLLMGYGDDTVDKIITCPPFGRQFAETVPPKKLLKEWSRVLKAETGRMVLLLSKDSIQKWIEAVISLPLLNIECRRVPFSLGPNLDVSMLVISKVKQPLPKQRRIYPRLLDWEIGMKEKGRGLWAKQRSQSLPSLVPYSENQQAS